MSCPHPSQIPTCSPLIQCCHVLIQDRIPPCRPHSMLDWHAGGHSRPWWPSRHWLWRRPRGAKEDSCFERRKKTEVCLTPMMVEDMRWSLSGLAAEGSLLGGEAVTRRMRHLMEPFTVSRFWPRSWCRPKLHPHGIVPAEAWEGERLVEEEMDLLIPTTNLSSEQLVAPVPSFF